MSVYNAALNRALDAASSEAVMGWVGRLTGRAAVLRRTRYARARAALGDLSVATRVDLVRAVDVAADVTDAARDLERGLAALDAYITRRRKAG